MIEIVKFKAQHWHDIDEQEATMHLRVFFTSEQIEKLEDTRYSYTAVSEGRVVACGGVFEYWPGRGEAWMEMAKTCKREFLEIHNAVKRFLDICPLTRIEMTVDSDFDEGHRWARSLGFEMEAERMRKYGPDGKDYALYARIK